MSEPTPEQIDRRVQEWQAAGDLLPPERQRMSEPFPNDPVQRQARREENLARAHWDAERRGQSAECSWNCTEAQRQKATLTDHWCKNDGSTCLCACHDLTIRKGIR